MDRAPAFQREVSPTRASAQAAAPPRARRGRPAGRAAGGRSPGRPGTHGRWPWRACPAPPTPTGPGPAAPGHCGSRPGRPLPRPAAAPSRAPPPARPGRPGRGHPLEHAGRGRRASIRRAAAARPRTPARPPGFARTAARRCRPVPAGPGCVGARRTACLAPDAPIGPRDFLAWLAACSSPARENARRARPLNPGPDAAAGPVARGPAGRRAPGTSMQRCGSLAGPSSSDRTLTALPGRQRRPAPRALGGQDRLDLEVERDLVGHDHAAVLHGRVEVHVEVAPVDLAGRGEARPWCRRTGPGRSR